MGRKGLEQGPHPMRHFTENGQRFVLADMSRPASTASTPDGLPIDTKRLLEEIRQLAKQPGPRGKYRRQGEILR